MTIHYSWEEALNETTLTHFTARACMVWAASPALPDSEEQKVLRVITDLAEAHMAFPQTRDRHSVMKYFAPDYSYFDDIGSRSLQDVNTYWPTSNEISPAGRSGLPNRSPTSPCIWMVRLPGPRIRIE